MNLNTKINRDPGHIWPDPEAKASGSGPLAQEIRLGLLVMTRDLVFYCLSQASQASKVSKTKAQPNCKQKLSPGGMASGRGFIEIPGFLRPRFK